MKKNLKYENARKEIKSFLKQNKYYLYSVLLSDIEIMYGEKAAEFLEDFDPDFDAILFRYSLFSEKDDLYDKQDKIIKKIMTHLRKTVKAKWYENIDEFNSIIYFTKDEQYSAEGIKSKQAREIHLSDNEADKIKKDILKAEKYAISKTKNIKEDNFYNLDHPVLVLKNFRDEDLHKIFQDIDIGCQKCGNALYPEFHLTSQYGLTKKRTKFAERFVEKMKELGYEAYVHYHSD